MRPAVVDGKRRRRGAAGSADVSGSLDMWIMMAAMDIVLNRRAGVSVRDQLVAQIEMNILGGALGPGQRMPSVRALARRLSVHPNTVSAAYQELQDAGYVERRQGSGVFLCAETA